MLSPFLLTNSALFTRELTMITGEMIIGDVIRRHPQTMPVFERNGLNCYDCQIADFEAVEHGASVHKVDIKALLSELNNIITQ